MRPRNAAQARALGGAVGRAGAAAARASNS